MAEEKLIPIAESEQDVPFQGAAILANRFFITMGASGVRIAFAEQGLEAKPPVFRTAVAMSFQDGIELAKKLRLILKDIEDTIAQQIASLQEKENAAKSEEKTNGSS